MGILAYGLIALAIMSGIGYGYKVVKDSGRDEVRAELQPKLDSCQAEIAKQNAAVAALAAESARRQAASAAALSKAAVKGKVWEDQAVRLQRVLTAQRPAGEPAPTDCRAAWSEIRGQK